MNVMAMGVHVLDVLVRPVEEIPEGQGGQLVDEIRITPAGTAGGTALILAKLGASVRSAGPRRTARCCSIRETGSGRRAPADRGSGSAP